MVTIWGTNLASQGVRRTFGSLAFSLLLLPRREMELLNSHNLIFIVPIPMGESFMAVELWFAAFTVLYHIGDVVKRAIQGVFTGYLWFI